MRRMTMRRTAAALVVLIGAGGAAACGSDGVTQGGTATTTSPTTSEVEPVAPGEVRYLVLPEDTPGLVVVVDDATGDYASGVVRADRSVRVANVHPAAGVSAEAFDEVADGGARATLANGLEVASACGGRTVTSASIDDPTGDTVLGVAGPLMVLARIDGGYVSIEDTPSDTGACTQPTSVEGPLVDMAASLRWVDEVEFRRLVAAYPGPDQATTPTTG